MNGVRVRDARRSTSPAVAIPSPAPPLTDGIRGGTKDSSVGPVLRSCEDIGEGEKKKEEGRQRECGGGGYYC